jgi:tetraacyldisaccharide 4'-kinase
MPSTGDADPAQVGVLSMRYSEFLNRLWYGQHPLAQALAPLSWLYRGGMAVRRFLYRCGVLPVHRLPVPVIVVGNLTVGGTGKTPLIIWLAGYLKTLGYRPGIVSRGYGGRFSDKVQQVRPDSDPDLVGDEPVVIARRTGCPVAVARQRHLAARGLVDYAGCDIILCDDGLQHLALGRDIEIAVIDGVRRFGNGFCLPAGPLRESSHRLHSVHMVVTNGRPLRGEHVMEYRALALRALGEAGRMEPMESWRGRSVHAVAGIGNPPRFFALLRHHGLAVIPHEFPDHHRYRASDLRFGDDLPVVMTEKDAVKCERFAGPDYWYVPITAALGSAFEYRLQHLLKELERGQETA